MNMNQFLKENERYWTNRADGYCQVNIDELKSECATSKQRIPINNISQIFGVILADAWNETKIKNNIITSYREKSFIGKYLATERIKNPIYDVREFNQSKTLEKYKLLSLAWELI